MESGNSWEQKYPEVTNQHNNATPNVQPTPTVPRTRKSSGGAAVGIVVIALFLGLAGVAFGIIAIIMNSKPVATTGSSSYVGGNALEFEETSVANIVAKVTPAVVSIISESRSNNAYYRYYYGEDAVQSAAGTGMIVTADGYIITNRHVVEGATRVQVITDAGDTYDDVSIVGVDPLNDVAYLKIDGVSDLPTIPLGDSKTIALGQPVLAIGNALGAYQNTVTQGIIGGMGRTIVAGDENGKNNERLIDMIQTDAAINPGNSGGPLVNAAGEVIGINSAVDTDANGLGFAIPISATKGMLYSIIENNDARRAYAGVQYLAITPDIAKEYNLSVTKGAYVYSESGSSAVVKGGPADRAGIKDGDIITKVGDVEVGSAGSVSSLIAEYKVGDTVKLTLLRKGETMTVDVTLGAYQE